MPCLQAAGELLVALIYEERARFGREAVPPEAHAVNFMSQTVEGYTYLLGACLMMICSRFTAIVLAAAPAPPGAINRSISL